MRMGFCEIRHVNFRNLQNASVNLRAKQIYLIGENGQGKTNFLESVYMLCFGGSFRTRVDSSIVQHGLSDMSITGTVLTGGDMQEQIQLQLKYQHTKKNIFVNGKKIKDRKELVQQVPCIVFSHEDIGFVSGAPEKRRWFFNQTMSLYNPLFIDLLRRYGKIIKMRNSAIKNWDVRLLDVLDEQTAEVGCEIQKRRSEAIVLFNETFSNLFHAISGLEGDMRISYEPSWKGCNNVKEALVHLESKRARDRAILVSTSGPHRDRIRFMLQNHDFSKIASTGQLRLMSLILRVAQAIFFTNNTGRLPILLLDDVLLELDAGKRHRFLQYLPEHEQSFFTFLPDEKYQAFLSTDAMVYRVVDGALSEAV